MSTEPEALRLAELLELGPRRAGYSTIATELRRLHMHELANIEWMEKTHWVRIGAQPGELGMHRADVIKQRFDRLNTINGELLALLIRYRNEIPLGHQPYMIAHKVDAAITKATGQ